MLHKWIVMWEEGLLFAAHAIDTDSTPLQSIYRSCIPIDPAFASGCSSVVEATRLHPEFISSAWRQWIGRAAWTVRLQWCPWHSIEVKAGPENQWSCILLMMASQGNRGSHVNEMRPASHSVMNWWAFLLCWVTGVVWKAKKGFCVNWEGCSHWQHLNSLGVCQNLNSLNRCH